MFAFNYFFLLFKNLFFAFSFSCEPPTDRLCRFCSGGDNQLGRQKAFPVSKGIVGFMMKFNSIGNTVFQSEGYDMIKDLGISKGLVFEDFWIKADWDFNCFNHFIYAQYINR